MEIHPTRIPGRWREGYALDIQTVKSVCLGEDEYGHPRFENERSAMGECLKQLKYDGDLSVVPKLVETAVAFIEWWQVEPDLIVPVPPSRPRNLQPVILLVEEFSNRLGIPAVFDAVTASRVPKEMKDVDDFNERMRLLDGAYTASREKTEGKRVLLFDDLFRSGATMNVITSLILDQGGAIDVYALTLTRTRSNR